MRKKVVMAVILLVSGIVSAHAQFNQNGTQRKRQLEQIAALKVYLDYLKKGYNVVRDGNNLISTIKSGDWGLHSGYFSSRKTVNPTIRSSDKISAIVSLHQQMMQERQQVLRTAVRIGRLTPAEMEDLRHSQRAIQEDVDRDLQQLQLIITNGQLDMSDDERLAFIDKLYTQTGNKRIYQNRLHRGVYALIHQRRQGVKDQRVFRGFHE